MGYEYRKREILAVRSRAEFTPQWPRHSHGHGKGAGRRIKHQRDDLGSRPQERLGLLCIRNWGPSVGAMNRCLILIAASRTGKGHPIQDIAEPADRYSSSRYRIRTRPLQPCLREYAHLGSRLLKIKTAGSWRPMVAHLLPTCACATENANLSSVRMFSATWTSQTSPCSPMRWLRA